MSYHEYVECDREGCDQRYELHSTGWEDWRKEGWYYTPAEYVTIAIVKDLGEKPERIPAARNWTALCSVMCAGRWEKDHPQDPDELAGKVFRAAQEARSAL